MYNPKTKKHTIASPRVGRIEQELCKFLIVFLCMMLFLLFLTSCSIISYSGNNPDGSTTSAWGFEIGTKSACSGCNFSADKNGRSVTIGETARDVNVEALKTVGTALGAAVGEAAKVYSGKP